MSKATSYILAKKTSKKGRWLPLYLVYHFFVDRDGHLISLCGMHKAPGGTSRPAARVRCKICKSLLEGGTRSD